MERLRGAEALELAQLDRLQALVALGSGRNEGALEEAMALLTALATGSGFRGIVQSHLATVRYAVENLVKS